MTKGNHKKFNLADFLSMITFDKIYLVLAFCGWFIYPFLLKWSAMFLVVVLGGNPFSVVGGMSGEYINSVFGAVVGIPLWIASIVAYIEVCMEKDND